MVVVSTLRAAGTGLRCLKTPFTQNASAILPAKTTSLVLTRLGSDGGRTMQILPSRFEYRTWKDHFHFFVALGLIPMGFLITAVNLFHGPTELRELPEDHYPKYWEYYSHPISRWFSRYVYADPQKIYERNLHHINYENQRRILRLTEKRVRQLMADKQDVKGWYYVPTNERRTIVSRLAMEDLEADQGTK